MSTSESTISSPQPESLLSDVDTSTSPTCCQRKVCSTSVEKDPEFDDSVAPSLDGSKQDPNPAVLGNQELMNFIWTTSPQPHAVRRRMILEKYPEIEQLYGADQSQAYLALVVFVAQIFMAYYVSITPMSWSKYLILVFCLSATLNHSLFAAMHEGSHRTIFTGKFTSELFCIGTTIPMGLPAAISFKRYHLDHHIYMGVDVMDPDIPTMWEGLFFRSTLGKFLWIFLLPATYSLRPMITRPKNVVPMDILNWILNVIVDFSIAYFWGLRSLGYLLLGTFFSMNFHPFAGHFISEHFIFPGNDPYQETSSYYGLWNALTYNVGYHNEHHDFPRVPGSKLPLVTEIAKDFYQMPHCGNWMSIMWQFLLTPSVTPFNRVKRVAISGGTVHSKNEKSKLHQGHIPNGGQYKYWPKCA